MNRLSPERQSEICIMASMRRELWSLYGHLKKIMTFFRHIRFKGSESYWIRRYAEGGNSGSGSYNNLAKFKAGVINEIVQDYKINTVVEFGCGDGNQLKLAVYPRYLGLDISPKAIEICRSVFADDDSKMFQLVKDYTGEKADMAISLDVIYHLVEDDIFENYMKLLFDSSRQYVIIYSSNFNQNKCYYAPHVRHRKFTDWINANRSQWSLLKYLKNPFHCQNDDGEISSANFYIYTNCQHQETISQTNG